MELRREIILILEKVDYQISMRARTTNFDNYALNLMTNLFFQFLICRKVFVFFTHNVDEKSICFALLA